MILLPCFAFDRSIRLYPRITLELFAGGAARHLQNSDRRILTAALSLLVVFFLAGSLPAQQAPVKRQALTPLVTGTDSSQTGTANFFGDFTAISSPTVAVALRWEWPAQPIRPLTTCKTSL